jgi:hypothetical protein
MSQPQIPESVAKYLRSRREQLLAERATMTASIDREIADIDLVLSTVEPVDIKPQVVQALTKFNTKNIVAATEALIAAGRAATTQAVRDSLAHSGVELPEDALRRITKALTRTNHYNGHRTHGWTHKASVMNGAGVSN